MYVMCARVTTLNIYDYSWVRIIRSSDIAVHLHTLRYERMYNIITGKSVISHFYFTWMQKYY